MENFFFAVAFVLIFILWMRIRTLKKDLTALQSKLNSLMFPVAGNKITDISEKTGIKLTDKKFDPPLIKAAYNSDNAFPPLDVKPAPELQKNLKKITDIPAISTKTDELIKKITDHNKIPTKEIKAKIAEKPKETLFEKSAIKQQTKPHETPEIFLKFQKQFIENWTGIIGAAIMVMGIGFLSIYAAVALSAVYRFIMLCGVVIFLFISSLILIRKEKWIKLARWLRSSSGAVVMFAFIGAGGIPGLKFIDDPLIALILLITGIILNLYFGYAGGTEYFASLHSIISLASISVAPQNMVTFIIAGIVVFASIAITYKSRWEYHLLVSISGFFVYHIYWYKSIMYTAENLPLEIKISGITVTLIVGVMAIFSHYRKIYKTDKFDTLPFVVHILNWAFLAIGLMMYSTGLKWNTIILAIASVIIFYLAGRAKKLGIRWLFLTDVLISQSLAIFTIITLTRWDLDNIIISGIAFMEIIIFYFIIKMESDWFLQKIGMFMHHISLIVLIGFSIYFINFDNEQMLYKNSTILFVVFIIETVFHLYNFKKHEESFDSLSGYFSKKFFGKISISGVIIPLLALVLWYFLHRYFWGVYIITAFSIFLLLLRQKFQLNGVGIGSIILVPSVFLISWQYLLGQNDLPGIRIIIYSAPLFILSVILIFTSYIKTLKQHIKWAGIYLFSINLVLVTYILFQPVSNFLPGILWLLFSVLYFEAAQFIREKFSNKINDSGNANQFILHASYIFIAMFLLRHFIVDLQTEAFIGNFPVRFIIEFFAVAVFIYIAMGKEAGEGKKLLSWKYLHPLFWELAVIFATVIIILEVPDNYHSLAWIISSLFLLAVGRFTVLISRMRFYSVLFYWAAVFSISFMLTTQPFPSENWFDQSWVAGIATIILQFIYIILFYKNILLDVVEFPAALHFFKAIADIIKKRKNIIIYYLFTAEIIYSTYKFFHPVSPFIPAILWLIFSVIYLELSQYVRQKYKAELLKADYIDSFLLNSGFLLIAAFLVYHFLVVIQTELYLGIFHVRMLIEIFASAVFIYWIFTKRPQEDINYIGWKYLHPLMIELEIIFIMTVLILETQAKIQPLLWISGSLLLLFLGRIFKKTASRLRFYSLIFHWITVFNIAFILTSYIVPSSDLLDQMYFWGSLAILMQFIFIIFFYKYSDFENIHPGVPLEFLSPAINSISKFKNLAVYYPFFISIALFIYKSFNESLYTLFWVIEAFAIFIVSVILKENHFRYLSMCVLAVCLVRLMIYDLSKSGTLLKGVVFLSVGILMLVMNTIYNKFKSRF